MLNFSIPSPLELFKSAPASLQPWMRASLIKALKLGPLPKHVAFVMDGNRRYAKGKGEDVVEGHEAGFVALKKLLEFLLHLNISNVTVYAFSIENFARPQREVDKLMNLAKTRLVELCGQGQLLHQHSVRIRFLGRLDLLPDDVRESCLAAEELTKDNTRGVLNVCFPYTSRDEITRAVREVVNECVEGEIEPEDITPIHIDERLYSAPSPPPDLFIRTGGVSRFSDFMLWQSNQTTKLHWIPPHWPDITVVDMLPLLLGWQAEEMAKRALSWTG